MKSNVGKTDKVIRIILGIVIAAAGFYFQTWWGLLALVPILTALMEFCPLYKVLGISTCPRQMSSNPR